MDGFVNFLKPPGMTSHDAVGYVRRQLGVKRVGHAGTLDPGAAGVLPVAVGRATRLVEYFDGVKKAYRAEMLLGVATDSGDDSGKVVEQAEDFLMPSEAEILEAFQHFTGVLTQVPPAHSAIKINGRRACDLLREGVQVKIPARQVEIHALKLIKIGKRHILFDVECSKGTYIRSLCADLGAYLKIPATMSFLVRRTVGEFSLENAISVEELADAKEKALLPLDCHLGHIQRYDLAADRLKAFCSGLPTDEKSFAEQFSAEKNTLLRVYCKDNFIGIGRFDRTTGAVFPEKVVFVKDA